MVRIGIDARFYGTKHTGIGRYTKNVLIPLVKLLPDHKLLVFLRDPYFSSLKLGKGVQKVRCNLPHYSAIEQLFLPSLIKKHKLDLWFSFHFNTPIFSRIKKITVIHDLIKTFSTGPDTTTRAPCLYKIKRWGYNKVMEHAVRKSREVIVPTNSVKNDLLGEYSEPPEKIHPIWEAPDINLQNTKSTTKISLTLPPNYLLFVGNAYPHKNLLTLLNALNSVKNEHLIIVASSTPYLDKLMASLSSKTRDRITILSSLTDSQLGYLYKNASLLIAPSLMEGFGLPGLEALTLGTKVVASDIPVFREVYGSSVTYFDPHSAPALVRAIKKAKKAKFSRLKYSRDWETVATDIAEVINESSASL